MTIKNTLETLGLSKNESEIYLKLLETGSAKAGKISKECHLDRSATYNALTNLLNKGLVSYANIQNVKWFQAVPPKRLMDILNEKKSNLKKIMPELEGKFKQTKLKGQVTLHKGIKGVETVFQDILTNADENLIFGSEGQFQKRMPFFFEHFLREEEKRGIKKKVIVRGARKDSYIDGDYKFVDTGVESPVVTNIYKNKIALIIWTTEPEAIIIENKEAADSYRSYFEFMWKNAK